MLADRRGTMGKHGCQNDEPAVSTHIAEYGTLGIIELKKTLMEQSDRLGEITGEDLARTPIKQVAAEIREVIDTLTETVDDFTLSAPE